MAGPETLIEIARIQRWRSGEKANFFDLDGTLAESRSSLDTEMSALLHDLLRIVKVALISGGAWPQFEKQLLSNLPHDEGLVNLSLLPTCGTKFFQCTGDWKKIYSEDFTADEKEKIVFGNSRQRLRLFRQRLSTDFPRPLWTETRWR